MEVKPKNYKICDICKADDATSLCLKCFSYYCEDCYKTVHKKKENKEHKKEEIDYNVPIDTHCSLHSGNDVNLFCLDEKGNLKYLYYILLNIIIYSTLLCLLFI